MDFKPLKSVLLAQSPAPLSSYAYELKVMLPGGNSSIKIRANHFVDGRTI
jgi:hypothetical protein